MQQSAYRTSSNGQYEQNSNFISPENIRWNNVAYSKLDGRKVRVLVDSWYMRRIFIESMLARGFDVIGQVRIDTRLYDEPPKRKKGQRGRPRKYGRKYTPKRIAHLKRSMVTLPLYGKEQEVRYRSKVLMAHFLGGRLVRVV